LNPDDLFLIVLAAMLALQMAGTMISGARGELPQLLIAGADLAVMVGALALGAGDSIFAFVAAAVALLLLIAPRALQAWERRLLSSDRLLGALRLAQLRAMLVPGRASDRRRRYLRNLVELSRDGALSVGRRLDEEIARAKSEEARAELQAEWALVLFMQPGRAEEAVRYVEQNLSSGLSGRPLLYANLVQAYGELGRLDDSAKALESLEREMVEPAVILGARLAFVAATGSVAALEEMLRKIGGGSFAEHLLLRARERAAMEISDELRSAVRRVLDRTAAMFIPVGSRHYATLGLCLCNFLLFLPLFVQPVDAITLVRMGALFRPATLGGEWWRLFSALFLHAGVFHVAINMLGLWMLGRFLEQVFGTLRYLLVYFIAGTCASVCSTLLGRGPISVGASGAIMGVLGAIFVVAVIRRGLWPEAVRRALIANLAFVVLMQVALGIEVPMIDNAAHVGGLIAGALIALAFSQWRAQPPQLLSVCGATLLTLVYGFVARNVIVTSAADTLLRLPERQVVVNHLRLRVPYYWEVQKDKVVDPILEISLRPEPGPLDLPEDDTRLNRLWQHIESTKEPE
jgi:membrane associated rhomboid family serine protease